MNDYASKARAYLDRKKPRRSENVTSNVKVEVERDIELDNLRQALAEFKQSWKTPIFIFKACLTIFFIIAMLWCASIISIQNDCYLDKECREWIKNR